MLQWVCGALSSLFDDPARAAIASALLGVLATYAYDRLRGPRAELLRLESSDVDPEHLLLGAEEKTLHRIVFRVKGGPTGFPTAIRTRWGPHPLQGDFAKWDETSEPLTTLADGRRKVVPELIPSTFFLPTFKGSEYSVPIAFSYTLAGERRVDAFSAWWWLDGYTDPERFGLTREDVIQVRISGMKWTRWLRFRTAEIAVPVASLLDSDRQGDGLVTFPSPRIPMRTGPSWGRRIVSRK